MSISRTTLSVLTLATLLNACGEDVEVGASSDTTPRAAPTAQPVMGAFELPDSTFPFRVTRCDLTGSTPDGIYLRGSGTMPDGSMLLPDGRRLGIEVERLTPDMGGPGWLYERATVQFGSMMDEDGWEATASSQDGSTWVTGDMMESLEGPIIEVSGNDLVVAGRFKHASRDERLDGTLTVTCPRPTYP